MTGFTFYGVNFQELVLFGILIYLAALLLGKITASNLLFIFGYSNKPKRDHNYHHKYHQIDNVFFK